MIEEVTLKQLYEKIVSGFTLKMMTDSTRFVNKVSNFNIKPSGEG